LDLGASIVGEGVVRFKVWAPLRERASVILSPRGNRREIALQQDQVGYFHGVAGDVPVGGLYLYLLDNDLARPDPASRSQPEGVHGPSRIIDPDAFSWEDDGWTGILFRDFIIYEIHVGTFTKEGTFEAVIGRLEYLRNLGCTALELMPVAQFPGTRNWGYDGVYPFAPQESYGGPDGLKRLINACHREGLAVVLDVVYNHLGPEGNYLGSFAPYFTDRYKTPWGEAINFDGPYSDEVRRYFIDNARYWVAEYHVDALRIDAIQGIFDFSACHFLKELAQAVHSLGEALGRRVYVVAESDLNDVRVIDPTHAGGYALDSQWNDDFHHALHALVTGEANAYLSDFGELAHMSKALSEGFVYSGEYSPYRKRRHGSSSKDRPSSRFIVFSQNHDQVGNRSARPSRTQSLEQLKLAAAVVLLSPYVPLLFTGEEYAEEAPFNYFVSFSDQALVEAVRRGRKAELADFGSSEAPDPQAEATFLDAKIEARGRPSIEQVYIYNFYRALIKTRKESPFVADPGKERIEIRQFEGQKALFVERRLPEGTLIYLCNFNAQSASLRLALPEGKWVKALDSSSEEWGGRGQGAPESIESRGMEVDILLNPHSLVLYRADGA
jgi:maltooligosyltrehalose trehalohydrolase